MTQSEALLERLLPSNNRSIAPIDAQGFHDLCRQRSIEKRLLPFLKTAVDFDIVCEVGYNELMRVPLTVKHLILLDLAPQMTVFRRLNRLCDLGIVLRTRAVWDARVHELRLAPAVHPLLARFTDGSGDGKPG